MSRRGSKGGNAVMQCPFGLIPYATKRDAEAAGETNVKQCGRCKNYHGSKKKGKGRR